MSAYGTSRQGTGSRRPTSGNDAGTRDRLLNVAGQVFAEKGVDRATGKEICSRAKTNVAAINYHFGSFGHLYEAVLCEAHRRFAALESIRSAVDAPGSPESKLEAVFRLIVSSLTGPVSSSWVIRVLGRELVAPTAAISVLRESEVRPKVRLVLPVIAELMRLPVDHPAVARGCVSVIGPCLMLLIVDRRTFTRLFPHLRIVPDQTDAIVRHMTHFAVAGLRAVAAEAKAGR